MMWFDHFLEKENNVEKVKVKLKGKEMRWVVHYLKRKQCLESESEIKVKEIRWVDHYQNHS